MATRDPFEDSAPGGPSGHVIDADGDGQPRPRAAAAPPQAGFLKGLWEMVRDPRAEWVPKIIAVLAIAYVLMPFDAVPDFLPLIGWSDDLVAIVTALFTLASAVQRHRGDGDAPVAAGPVSQAPVRRRRAAHIGWTLGALGIAVAAILGIAYFGQ